MAGENLQRVKAANRHLGMAPKAWTAVAMNISADPRRATGQNTVSGTTVILRPPRILSPDQAIELIAEDERVEVTPQSVRLLKMELDATRRQMKNHKDA